MLTDFLLTETADVDLSNEPGFAGSQRRKDHRLSVMAHFVF